MWRTVLLLAFVGTAGADDTSNDDGTTKGAVPVPGEYDEPTITINHRDTTVRLAELPKLGAKWKQRERVTYKGVVPVAVNHSYAHVNLTFVDSVANESGYPGSLKRFPLVSSDDGGPWSASFPAFAPEANGPILAAIRVLGPWNHATHKKGPESGRRQVVVYQPKGKRIILVATKLLTEEKWTPLLRVDTPNATRISLIDPGWH
jgi:hypothetical protein